MGRRAAAYGHPSQYTLGRDVLVAPVATPGESPASTVWFPPGTWVDWFTGERHGGPATEQLTVPLSRMPVFVRAGGIVPMQPEVLTTPEGSPRSLVLLAEAGDGKTMLYDDSGAGFAYERGKFTRTTISQNRARGRTDLTISAARGDFALAPRRRSYEIQLAGVAKPKKVLIGGKRVATWSYRSEDRTAIIRTGARSTARTLRIEIG